jgi:hypothetical protein
MLLNMFGKGSSGPMGGAAQPLAGQIGQTSRMPISPVGHYDAAPVTPDVIPPAQTGVAAYGAQDPTGTHMPITQAGYWGPGNQWNANPAYNMDAKYMNAATGQAYSNQPFFGQITPGGGTHQYGGFGPNGTPWTVGATNQTGQIYASPGQAQTPQNPAGSIPFDPGMIGGPPQTGGTNPYIPRLPNPAPRQDMWNDITFGGAPNRGRIGAWGPLPQGPPQNPALPRGQIGNLGPAQQGPQQQPMRPHLGPPPVRRNGGFDGMRMPGLRRGHAAAMKGEPAVGSNTGKLNHLLDQMHPRAGRPSPDARIGAPIRGLDPMMGYLR